jgi:hypothetical protein
VLVALWSAEVIRVLRRHAASFAAVCPDEPNAFAAWWAGRPVGSGVTSTFVAFDPVVPSGRSRAWVGLDVALRSRPRHRGYAAVAAAVEQAR